jgi:hypothetical protein
MPCKSTDVLEEHVAKQETSLKQAASKACFMLFSCLGYSSTRNVEATCFFKMPVDFPWAAWHYVSEDGTLHSHCHENFSLTSDKSAILNIHCEHQGTIFAVMKMKIVAFCDIVCSCIGGYHHFKGTYSLHLLDGRWRRQVPQNVCNQL